MVTKNYLFFLFLLILFGFFYKTVQHKKTPQIILWSWQRQDNLSFLKEGSTVAPLISTLVIKDQNITENRRLNSLKLPKAANVIPVIRIEISKGTKLTDDTIDNIFYLFKRYIDALSPKIVQIDFDALKSQRGFYKKLLEKLTYNFSHIKWTITSLASWCLYDPWIDDLPIDYAIPMFYNLGSQKEKILANLKLNSYKSKKCKSIIGMHAKTMLKLKQNENIIFIFTDTPWTKKQYDTILKDLE